MRRLTAWSTATGVSSATGWDAGTLCCGGGRCAIATACGCGHGRGDGENGHRENTWIDLTTTWQHRGPTAEATSSRIQGVGRSVGRSAGRSGTAIIIGVWQSWLAGLAHSLSHSRTHARPHLRNLISSSALVFAAWFTGVEHVACPSMPCHASANW